MSTLNLKIPDTLQSFVDEQAVLGGYSSNNDYLCALISKEADRQQLKLKLLAGANAKPTIAVDAAYFDQLRQKVIG